MNQCCRFKSTPIRPTLQFSPHQAILAASQDRRVLRRKVAMPVRKRTDKRRQEVTDEHLAWLNGDDKASGFVQYAPADELAALWDAHSERIVADHVADFPGTRPVRWWQNLRRDQQRCVRSARPRAPLTHPQAHIRRQVTRASQAI